MSKGNRKRHTKPCIYFQTNDCPLSAADCDFAHVITSPEQYEVLKNPQSTLRTKPCRFYLSGQCRVGYWCRFKHPANLFAASRELSDASLLEDVPDLDSDKGTDDDVDVRELDGAWKARPEEHPRYRTRPCRNFILGKCTYGDRCSYLHVASPSSRPVSLAGSSPAGATTCPSPTSYFPTTPPPHNRAPPCTPASAQQSDLDMDILELDASVLKTPVRSSFTNDMQTPLTTSGFSSYSEEYPLTPGNNDYAFGMQNGMMIPPLPLPLSPLSPLANRSREFASKSAMRSQKSALECMPLSPPPLSMYSPTSPVPLQIVHVPFAVPVYQEMTKQSQSARRTSIDVHNSMPPLHQRAFFHPDAEFGDFSESVSQYRTKPCKFFQESGRCHKGNRCNFSHVATSFSPLGKRPPAASKESATRRDEKQERASSDSSQSLDSTDSEETKSGNSSGNYYKINWRVVGGGVKMASDNSILRRRSEDTPTLSQRRPSFKNPFDSINRRPSATVTRSPLGPAIDLKGRAHSVASVPNETQNTGFLSTTKNGGPDRALTLTLQAYSLAKASSTSKIRGTSEYPPPAIVVVQGNLDETADEMGGKYTEDEKKLVSRQDFTRAKSSPSSPVTAHHNLSNMVFSAESP